MGSGNVARRNTSAENLFVEVVTTLPTDAKTKATAGAATVARSRPIPNDAKR